MAQSYTKQLIFGWLRMVHREITEIEIGNAARSLSVSPTPSSHQSRDKPCWQTHYDHESWLMDIPPSAAR